MMGFSLLDKSFEFSALLHNQYERLAESVLLLHDLFISPQPNKEKCQRIHEIEAESRRVSREITRQLSLTFIMQVERADIHDLNLSFERALTAVKAVSTRIGLYGLSARPGSTKEITGCLIEIIGEIGIMLSKLVTKEPLREAPINVDKRVDEADMFLLVGLGEVYESSLSGLESVLDIVKWAQIYDRLEDAVDRIEDVANVIEGMALKNA